MDFKDIPVITIERVAAVCRRAGFGVERTGPDLTVKVDGNNVGIGVSREMMTIMGFWGGAAYEQPDREPLVAWINELNDGRLHTVVTTMPCGHGQGHIHLQADSRPILIRRATDAQLEAIIGAALRHIREAYGVFDAEFPGHAGLAIRAKSLRALSTVQRRRSGFGPATLGRVRAQAERMMLWGDGAPEAVTVVSLPGEDELFLEHGGQLFSVTAEGRDIVVRTVVPSGRCGCDVGELMAWVVRTNERQSIAAAHLILEGHDELNVRFTGRIPGGLHYTDEQLSMQLAGTLGEMRGCADDFYVDINPERLSDYVHDGEAS